jgi:hypothetical protein
MANIELTEEQYKKLLDLVFLGRWMSTSMKEDNTNEYEDIEQHILKYAEAFNAADYVEYDEKYGTFFTTGMLEEELDSIIEEYDEFTLWEQLAARFAERDLAREIGPVSKLTEKHYARKFDLEDEYTHEFMTNGIRNVVFQKK